MARVHRTIVLVLALGVTAAAGAQAGPKAAKARATPHKSLKARAKVSEDSARAIALREVPGGKVEKYELEEEKGKLVYSYDIKVPGKPGVEEIWVSAINGKMLSHEHESPAQEKAEAKKSAAKKP